MRKLHSAKMSKHNKDLMITFIVSLRKLNIRKLHFVKMLAGIRKIKNLIYIKKRK